MVFWRDQQWVGLRSRGWDTSLFPCQEALLLYAIFHLLGMKAWLATAKFSLLLKRGSNVTASQGPGDPIATRSNAITTLGLILMLSGHTHCTNDGRKGMATRSGAEVAKGTNNRLLV